MRTRERAAQCARLLLLIESGRLKAVPNPAPSKGVAGRSKLVFEISNSFLLALTLSLKLGAVDHESTCRPAASHPADDQGAQPHHDRGRRQDDLDRRASTADSRADGCRSCDQCSQSDKRGIPKPSRPGGGVDWATSDRLATTQTSKSSVAR